MRQPNLLIACVVLSLFSLIRLEADCEIDKTLLKYDRTKAVEFAGKNWYRTAEGFVNYGPSHLEVFTDDKIKEMGIDVKSDIYKECKDSFKIAGKCPGDCANFVSQCLMAGGIDHRILIKGVRNTSIIQKNGIRTVANAGELTKRLLQMGVYTNDSKCMKDDEGRSAAITLEMMEPGDIVFGKGPGASTRHPYLVGSKPVFVSEGDGYLNYTGFYSHSFSIDASDTTTLIEPLTLFHFPDITMVREVEIYQAVKDNPKKVYYHSVLNDEALKGDGKIDVDISLPIELPAVGYQYQVSNEFLLFSVSFTKAINKKHQLNSVALLPVSKRKETNSKENVLNEMIELQPVSLSEDGKNVLYVLTNQQTSGLVPGGYLIDIRFYSKDNTLINGKGTYEKYDARPDRNHKIVFVSRNAAH